MTPATTPSQPGSTLAFAGGTQSLQALRSKAGSDPRGAVKEAAKAFETMFMQELLKSMRASTMASGMLDNAGTKLGTEWLDAQFSQVASGRPGSLADMLEKQLDRQLGAAPGGLSTPVAALGMVPSTSQPGAVAADAVARASSRAVLAQPGSRIDRAPSVETVPSSPTTRSAAAGASQPPPIRLPQQAAADFIQSHRAAAEAAEAATGIPAAFMVSQAALETGWGRHQIRHADGSPSHNLFGIKAGGGWKGPVAEVVTTEYVDGRPVKVKEAFRAYASPAESFADYARLIGTSPRYAKVVEQADDAHGFAQGLQQAGYATDPNYADKLSRVINTTLRLQRTVA